MVRRLDEAGREAGEEGGEASFLLRGRPPRLRRASAADGALAKLDRAGELTPVWVPDAELGVTAA